MSSRVGPDDMADTIDLCLVGATHHGGVLNTLVLGTVHTLKSYGCEPVHQLRAVCECNMDFPKSEISHIHAYIPQVAASAQNFLCMFRGLSALPTYARLEYID